MRMGSDHRPHVYKTCALTTELRIQKRCFVRILYQEEYKNLIASFKTIFQTTKFWLFQYQIIERRVERKSKNIFGVFFHACF